MDANITDFLFYVALYDCSCRLTQTLAGARVRSGRSAVFCGRSATAAFGNATSTSRPSGTMASRYCKLDSRMSDKHSVCMNKILVQRQINWKADCSRTALLYLCRKKTPERNTIRSSQKTIICTECMPDSVCHGLHFRWISLVRAERMILVAQMTCVQ